MIFLTVGTQFPFYRLVRTVDEFLDDNALDEEIFAQIGESNYRPRNFEAVASLEKEAFDASFCGASAVISHAGMGTITMALDNGKPLLAMPRRKKHREVVNDHQVALAVRFAALGHIIVAENERQLAEKIVHLRTFVPRPRQVEPEAVAQRIRGSLEQIGRAG